MIVRHLRTHNPTSTGVLGLLTGVTLFITGLMRQVLTRDVLRAGAV
jgi:hypothetical protein